MNLENAKPILFNTEMVRAILDGRKTQTRRLVKSPSGQFRVHWPKVNPDNKRVHQADENMGMIDEKEIRCPYGYQGTILYVRETFYPCKHVFIDGEQQYLYRATYERLENFDDFKPKWKPSIHMPKEAARIFLKVTDVRVERLNNITDADCEAEGVRPSVDGNADDWQDDENGWHRTFRQLWDEIYKDKGYGWKENPWVWVVEFEKIEEE